MTIFQFLKESVSDFFRWGGWKLAFGLLGFIWFVIDGGLTFVENQINRVLILTQSLTGIPISEVSQAIFNNEYLRLANYLFPVQEALICLGVILAMYPIVVLMRIVKSWLPTVSG